jgi:tRNA(His) 5'-end guanylyltransferase
MPRPFYAPLHQCMLEAMEYLVQEVDTCVFGYTQSDEISLLLKDFTSIKTQAWFDNNQQKIVSNTASLLTAIFNDLAPKHMDKEYLKHRFAIFDSRAYNIPEAEVCNYFIWRQQDAIRNSINGVGQAHFSQKQLNGKKTDQVQQMLLIEKDVNWNDFPTWAKRGSCVRLNVDAASGQIEGPRIVVDSEIPIFTKARHYIDDLLFREQA